MGESLPGFLQLAPAGEEGRGRGISKQEGASGGEGLVELRRPAPDSSL